MKPTSSPLILLITAALGAPLIAADKPQEVLDAIAKLRTERLASAKAEGKRVSATLYQSDVLAKAKSALEGVDPAKVDLTDAAAWQELFATAQDYNGARTVARRWVAGSQGDEKFKAQTALITADARIRDYTELRQTILAAHPTDAASRIRLASLANTYVVNILTNDGPAAALEVLAAGEKALPSEGFTNDSQKDMAKRTQDNLAKTRQLMKDNPGKEAEAIEKSRRALLTQALGGAAGNTNALAAAAKARKERDAKLAKLTGTTAADFKAGQTIGEFKSLGELKGKVVMLDFFAHWCGPCIASFPSVHELYTELKPKGLEVVGVTRYYGYYKTEGRTSRDLAPEKEYERMKEFVKEHQMTWPVAFADKQVWDDYMCSAIPHAVLINRTGKIRKVKVGFSKDGAKAFHDEVAKILAE